MDIFCSFLGTLLWLLVGGIGGWIIHSLFYGSKITELTDSLRDRDSRLMAISRDHKAIIAEQEKKNLSIKSELTHLERSNTDLKNHNSDLRSTIDALRKSQEEHLALLFEPQTEIEVVEDIQDVISDSPLVQQANTPIDNGKAVHNSKQKLARVRKKLRKSKMYSIKLEEKIIKLTRTLKEKTKTKTIIKEVPVTIRQEVQIKESIDKKKLQKLFGFKVPTVKSKKTIQISKKKGKPVVVKQ